MKCVGCEVEIPVGDNTYCVLPQDLHQCAHTEDWTACSTCVRAAGEYAIDATFKRCLQEAAQERVHDLIMGTVFAQSTE